MAIGPARLEINPYRWSAARRTEPFVALAFIVRKIPRWFFERRERRKKGAGSSPEQLLAPKSKGGKNRTLMIEWQLGFGPHLNLSHAIFIKFTFYMININETIATGWPLNGRQSLPPADAYGGELGSDRIGESVELARKTAEVSARKRPGKNPINVESRNSNLSKRSRG
jgi:hypothetical protein